MLIKIYYFNRTPYEIAVKLELINIINLCENNFNNSKDKCKI